MDPVSSRLWYIQLGGGILGSGLHRITHALWRTLQGSPQGIPGDDPPVTARGPLR